MDRFLEQVAIEASQMYVTEQGKSPFASTVRSFIIHWKIEFFRADILRLCSFQTIEKLPDKVVLNIFSYLTHLEICRMGKIINGENFQAT